MKRGFVLLLSALLLTGCGGAKSTEYYEQGIENLNNQDYESAAKSFQQAVENGERLPESYRGLGISQLSLDDDAAAIAAFSRSLNELDGTNVEFETDVMYYLAQARKNNGEYEKAVEVYTELLDLDENAQTLFMRGCTYLDLGDEEHAAADFENAVSGSRDYEQYISICQVYRQHDMDMEGEAYLNRALEIEPQEASDYTSRGQVCYELQDYDRAKEELTKAINQKDTDAILLLGKVYLAMEDVASARGMYQGYLDQEENAAKAYNGLALCDIYEKNYKSALANVEAGLKEKGKEDQQSLLYNEAVIYEYMQEFDTAKSKMEEYLALYPEDEEAQREYEFLSTR